MFVREQVSTEVLKMNDEIMDHEKAKKTLAAERYLLGELNAEERQAYEEHFFSCNECFEQVNAGAEIVRYIKGSGDQGMAALKLPAVHAGFFAGLRQPSVFVALGLLLIVSGIGIYQASVISRLKGPRLESRSVLTGIAHGGTSAKRIQVPKTAALSLGLEYSPSGEFTTYGIRILSGSGEIKFNLAIPADQVNGIAEITMPAESMPPGRYSMVVWGRSNNGIEREVCRGSFELLFTD